MYLHKNNSPVKERELKSNTYENVKITIKQQAKSNILTLANPKKIDITQSKYLNFSDFSKGHLNPAY